MLDSPRPRGSQVASLPFSIIKRKSPCGEWADPQNTNPSEVMVFHRQGVDWVDRNAHQTLVFFYTRCGVSLKWPCRKVLVFHRRVSRRFGCRKANILLNFYRMSPNEPECATNWVPNAQNVQNHAFYGSKTRKRAVGNSETRMRKSINIVRLASTKQQI